MVSCLPKALCNNVRVLGAFIDSLTDVGKGAEMACSLSRSCTKVLREGKNTSNAHK
ncbi:MAG: hypothetical protein IJB86_10675 [Clostridia bacterium]|nr:hypothetical protein [Clostridia bacterium]